jgi:hypothetical protein
MHAFVERTLTTAVAVMSVAAPDCLAQSARDSAGIAIYDMRRLTAVPTAFAVDSANPLLQFTGRTVQSSVLGATAVHRLRDGRFVVAVATVGGPVTIVPMSDSLMRLRDSIRRDTSRAPQPFSVGGRTSTRELRIFDDAGYFVGSFGWAGTDSSQFSAPITLIRELPDGTLLAAAAAPGWWLFEPSGGFRGAVRDPRAPRVFGMFSDGTILGSWPAPRAAKATVLHSNDKYNVVVSSVAHGRFDLSNTRLATFPFVTTHALLVSVGPQIAGAARPASWPIIVYPDAVIGGDVLWGFDALTWEARRYDASGKLLSISRPPLPRRLVAGPPGGVVSADSVSRFPLRADDTGRLWMETGDNPVRRADRPSTRQWLVYEKDGRLLGGVAMPAGFEPMEIVGDLLFGTYLPKPRSGISIVAFRLTRPR